MTTSRALAIITVATLPLAALTARGFLSAPGAGTDAADPEPYQGGLDELAAARKVGDEQSVAPADPVGWGRPRPSRPADGPVEYQVAAALAEAGRAALAKGDAIADVTAAASEIGGLLAEPRRAEILALPGGQGLLESLQARRAGLQRHTKWLEDRADIARRITALEALLAGPPNGTNEKKCLAEINDVVMQFPPVVDDDDEAEPPNARTKSEDQALESMRSRASFRRDQHEAMTAAAPEEKLRRLEAFLEKHASASDPRDAGLVDEAQRERGIARLAVFRAMAERSETADGMVQALQQWLAASPAGPDNRRTEATAMIKQWLSNNVPGPPEIAELPRLRNLQETIMLFGGEEKRLLGVFEQIPNVSGEWRFWWDPEDRADPDFKRGRHVFSVPTGKEPMKNPAFVEIMDAYAAARERLLGAPLADGVAEAFAEESGKLAEQTTAHRAIRVNTNVPHKLQAAYDQLGKALEAACRQATSAAREFDSATRENSLRSLVP